MMRESLLKLVQFVSIIWLSLARTMTEYDAATFLADGQHMISNLATAMAVRGREGWATCGAVPWCADPTG